MFSKSSKRATHVPSIISAGTRISGDLTSEGEIQVDGEVDGDIRCHTLVVGETGNVTGEVLADIARIHGAITGLVRAKTVMLARTARMQGDIYHEALSIESGAYVHGRCNRAEDPLNNGQLKTHSLPAPTREPVEKVDKVGKVEKVA